MKNKFKLAAAGLLAMALVVGSVPASEGKGMFGGFGTCVNAYAADTTITLGLTNGTKQTTFKKFNGKEFEF